MEKDVYEGRLAVKLSTEEKPEEKGEELVLKRGLFNLDKEPPSDKLPLKSWKEIFFAKASEKAAIPVLTFPSWWANLTWPAINLKSRA